MPITEPILIKLGLKSSVLINQVSFKRGPPVHTQWLWSRHPTEYRPYALCIIFGHSPDNSTTHATH